MSCVFMFGAGFEFLRLNLSKIILMQIVLVLTPKGRACCCCKKIRPEFCGNGQAEGSLKLSWVPPPPVPQSCCAAWTTSVHFSRTSCCGWHNKSNRQAAARQSQTRCFACSWQAAQRWVHAHLIVANDCRINCIIKH